MIRKTNEMAYTGAMNARISQLRDHLSRYLDRVRAGGDAERLASLERRGLVRRGTGRLPAWWSKHRPVRVRRSVLADLRAERDSAW